MMRTILLAVAAATCAVCPAAASERTGFQAIKAGNWQAAERVLLSQRDQFAQRPELVLNLAAIYVATGRKAEALSLYRQVQAQPDIAMDMADGRVVGSHTIASKGIDRLAPAIAQR
jgi:thioredoxin-like negative regulator of GroEL